MSARKRNFQRREGYQILNHRSNDFDVDVEGTSLAETYSEYVPTKLNIDLIKHKHPDTVVEFSKNNVLLFFDRKS